MQWHYLGFVRFAIVFGMTSKRLTPGMGAFNMMDNNNWFENNNIKSHKALRQAINS